MSIRIILDTCIVRGMAHNSAEQLDVKAVSANTEELRFSLGDPTFLELFVALGEDRIDWLEWHRAVETLDELLDPEFPFFPGKSEIGIQSGLVDGDLELDKLACVLQSNWRYLAESQGPSDLQRIQYFTYSNGEEFKQQGVLSTSSRIQAEERLSWVKLMASNDSERAIRDVLRQEFGELSTNLEPVVRLLVKCLELAANGYNATSEKNKGDVFDFLLLFYLLLPDTVICTSDKTFIARLKDAGVKSGVVDIITLNSHVIANSVHELVPKRIAE